MERLISNIVSYLEYLSKNCGLAVSVHFEENILGNLPQNALLRLLEFNVHKNPYCMAIKRKKYNKCVKNQINLIAKNQKEPFVNVCHAGVCEYVYPVSAKGKAIGIISVSGYRKDENFPQYADKFLWENALCGNEIPFELCDTLIPPLEIMLKRLFESYAKETSTEYNKILQFLNEYHNNISLLDLCNHFGRSKSYISHMFKQKSGKTLRSYCNELKLEDARTMLSDTDLSVTDIAMETGFNDVSYFIYMFRNKYGVSPYKYKKGRNISPK